MIDDARVEADEVRECKRAHRMRESELRDRVDRLRIGDPLHERIRRFVHEGHEDAIRDEPGKVVCLRGRLPEVFRERDDGRRGLVGGLHRADHLDEREHRHRIEEVHPDHLLRPCRHGGERRDRDRRRVRGEDRLRREHLVRAPEDRLLHPGVLHDRLDEEVCGDELVDGRHAPEDLRRVGAALLGEPGKALLHRRDRALDRARRLVVQRDPTARRRDDLSDTPAHLAGPDDHHVLEPHGRSLGLRRGRARQVRALPLAEAQERPQRGRARGSRSLPRP